MSRKPTALINELYDELLAGNHAVVERLVAADYYSHTESREVDRASLLESCIEWMAPFHSLRREVILEVNEGDRGVVFHRVRAIERQTGREVRMRSADAYRVRDGLLCEHWGVLMTEGT